MKSTILLTFVSLSLLFAGCSSVSSIVAEDDPARPEGSISDDNETYTSLADFLRRVPGVSVTGYGEDVSVRMRGVKSFNTGITPLYIVDGQAVGTSYSQANSLVDPRDIDFVKVLKGPEASTYGIRRANGVIEIFTKKS